MKVINSTISNTILSGLVIPIMPDSKKTYSQRPQENINPVEKAVECRYLKLNIIDIQRPFVVFVRLNV
jgi:hypothetical protein